ncbi:MAG TPA: VanZ family protein [Chitinophagaceae bacterium]|nr:VanZ family protein [Chitinophagaceae bacterium]
MTAARRTIKIFTGLVLLLYMAVLARNILFRNGGPRYYKQYFNSDFKRYSVMKGWEKANTVPFRTINLYKRGMAHNNISAQYNIWGNLLAFVPFGILLPLFLPWFRHLFKMVFAGFALSLGFEMTQLITGLGIWDIDDLILNTAGTVGGYILFWIAALLVGLARAGRATEVAT